MRFLYLWHQWADFSKSLLLPYTKYGYRLRLRPKFLAHRISISEILPWDRKSYLTQAILPVCYIHWLYWNSCTWSSSNVIVMFKWRHHVQLDLGVFMDLWKLILKLKKQWWARKRIHYLCEGRIEKSVPRDHRLSSLGKARDAKRWPLGQIFLFYPHTHGRFLYYTSSFAG